MAKDVSNTITEYHLNRHQPEKTQFAVHDLGDYLNKNRNSTTKPHIHSFYQIVWFKHGKGNHFVDFKACDVVENTVFFIAKNQVHYFDRHTGYDGVLIHFSELFLGPDDNGIDFLVKRSLFNNPYQRPSCCIGCGIEQVLEEYIRQIRVELSSDTEFAREELLRTYLKAFLIQVQRGKNEFEKSDEKAPFAPDGKRAQLIRFVNLVDENFSKGLTVSEYAALMHISTRTLSDLTGHMLNKTPSAMIQERIILEAQRLLLHSSLNINQIAYRLGFDDPSYFVKYFRKHANTSPSEFRMSVS